MSEMAKPDLKVGSIEWICRTKDPKSEKCAQKLLCEVRSRSFQCRQQRQNKADHNILNDQQSEHNLSRFGVLDRHVSIRVVVLQLASTPAKKRRHVSDHSFSNVLQRGGGKAALPLLTPLFCSCFGRHCNTIAVEDRDTARPSAIASGTLSKKEVVCDHKETVQVEKKIRGSFNIPIRSQVSGQKDLFLRLHEPGSACEYPTKYCHTKHGRQPAKQRHALRCNPKNAEGGKQKNEECPQIESRIAFSSIQNAENERFQCRF